MYPEDMDESILKYANDYKMNLISPAKMTDQQLDVFRSDLKAVLKFIKHSRDKVELANLVNNNQDYKSLDRLAAQTISVCSGQNFNFPVGEERIDVCKAIDDMIMDARNEAQDEGMKNVVATVRVVLCQDLVQHKMRNFNYFQLTNCSHAADSFFI